MQVSERLFSNAFFEIPSYHAIVSRQSWLRHSIEHLAGVVEGTRFDAGKGQLDSNVGIGIEPRFEDVGMDCSALRG